ncbi:MAG: hypothetical protein WBC19_11380 [Pyrinomonadaceae bacterium]|nr:hypothetical protein [Pyrinomonadaceae bacterium]
MNKYLLITLALVSAITASAQRSNDAIQKQIKSLKADKQITLTFDGGSTKIMAIADNFADSEAKTAGIQAMNFGMAFNYAGKDLSAPPDTINFTFWVMSKKPKFADAHGWKATIGTETLDLGDARYAAKPGENMEYLNFKLKREDLAKIAGSTGKITLGSSNFTFTASQLSLLKNIIAVSDSH